MSENAERGSRNAEQMAAGELREFRVAVARSARYFALGEPNAGTREVWFACHGYGQLAARFIRHLAGIAEPGRVIVAPEGLSRFYLGTGEHRNEKVGASWMTREDRLAEIDDYVRYLDALHAEVFARVERASVTLHLFGYSQGTATVCRWAARRATRVDRLILWAGAVPPDLDLAGAAERFRRLRLLFVLGRKDEYITPKIVAREEERLRSHGIPFEVKWFEGGHEIDAELLKELGQ